MSHQVVITFDIDENRVQENAEKEAGRQIANKVVEKAFGNYYGMEGRIKGYAADIVTEILEPYKEEIIAQAVRNVTASISRSKAVKEKLQETLQ